jgi:hypothetical protein
MRSSRWSSRGRSARKPVAITAALFAVYAVALGTHATPGSRLTAAEAHVLLTTESIVRDRDLDVRNQYAHRAWTSFYGGELHPTASADQARRILEPQGIGLPLLLAPAYDAGGATGARLFLALLLAVAFACGAALARRAVPDPWATAAALALGLSPPAVAAATSIHPEVPAAAALAAAGLLALRVRDDPRAAPAFWAAVLLALVPWMGITGVLAAAVVALAMTRWLRRRRRGLAGFAALEVVITSAVVFITINDKLFGGLTPYANRAAAGPATGLHDVGDALSRIPRAFELLGDTGRWAPFAVLVLVGGWLLARASREHLGAVVTEYVNVEVVAVLAALVIGAQVFEGGLLAPHLHGAWFPTRFIVPALPFAAIPAAWALRHHPRIGTALGVATVALTVWMLATGLWGDAALAPPSGFGFA